ncbi:hypothetical protein [Mucilaginibacter auburnensis]|uniref:Uncharacterized protein n=1 Tax=Mucilaginibacter auburnensis TaxID=1457233 RepID=A0A2H9VPX7_9SPHI|nr:hypothetical protein [Mucilaginibacter auburnensis]PJJ80398.1 hypothetical protein CLV57_3548 [Mucilaginibacter auburnensis]
MSYSYNFFPGAIEDSDCPWCANNDNPLIKGDDAVSYNWDKKTNTYKLDIPTYKEYEGLTAAQIACFYGFGNDEAFIAAYRTHIDKTLKKGTEQQKQVLKKYLGVVNSNKKRTPNQLEKKASAGGTTFYGPKNP